MQLATAPRILQLTVSLAIFIATGLYWHYNQIGQNIINITAGCTLLIGLDNILIYYRCYIQKSSYQTQGTFIIFCLYMLGNIFQNFNQSYGSNIWFNFICKYMLLIVLVVNASYYIAVLVILIGYLMRQIYRLMTQTLLSPTTVIQPRNLNTFIQKNQTTYEILHVRYPTINNSCSICLLEFQDNNQCVALPSCLHCFHVECITEWLNTRSSCPYCRYNIQLDIQLQNY